MGVPERENRGEEKGKKIISEVMKDNSSKPKNMSCSYYILRGLWNAQTS